MRTERTHNVGCPSEFGTTALAIWGCIAFASVVLATVVLFAPPDGQNQSQRVAAEQAPVHTPREESDATPAPQPPAEQQVLVSMGDSVRTASIEPRQVAEKSVSPQPVAVPRFGADIGGSSSVSKLLTRYRALRDHAPDLFRGVLPLVALRDSGDTLQARLVAGPFSSQEERTEFCESLTLRLSVACAAAAYEGDDLL